jgi:Na+/melibiose symporter-like transporter
LAVTYLSYSILTVAHQAWGARLGGDEAQRARVVAWREALALVGVLVASVLPSVVGLKLTVLVFGVALFIGLAALRTSPRPEALAADLPSSDSARPLSTGPFRRLLAVYLLNGIASAIPATLVLFFIRDRLQVPSWEPVFLAGYFAAGAVSIPLWVRCVKRFGLPRTWLAGMLLAVATFAWAATLGAGDATAFLIVCVLSGVALGADLSLPSALLAGVIQQAGHSGQREGAYFGWWNFATKLNLALAAGVALPSLQLFGYAPGSRDTAALTALTAAYCLLPCGLKLLAAALLFTQWVRPSAAPSSPSPSLLKDLP